MSPDAKLANARFMLDLARSVRYEYPWANELIILLEEEVRAFEEGDDEIGHFINREVIAFCTDRMRLLGELAEGNDAES